MIQGRVIRSTGKWYKILLENGDIVDSRLKGKLRLSGFKSTNPVAVGDNVHLEKKEEEFLITGLIPRKNFIPRKSVNLSKRVHILGSNIDQALIFFTLDQPVTTLGYIDRLLISCEAYDVEPVLIFNKIDLVSSEALKAKLSDYSQLYSSLGYKSLLFSCLEKSHEKTDKLIDLLKEKTSIVVGRSGAGKSSLINLIAPELNLKIGEISNFSGRGKHTTTFAELHKLPFGGFIIDSPGFKDMTLFGFEREEITKFFPEMLDRQNDCKYSNCLHIHEPGCKIKTAVERGEIATSRYNTYQGMLEEIHNY